MYKIVLYIGAVCIALYTSFVQAAETPTLVKDIYPSNSADIRNAVFVNGVLLFRASDASNGAELWKSDGTSSGTTLVKDIRAGSTGSLLDSFAVFNNLLLFSANDGTYGFELWKSDGTEGGTTLVKDIYTGSSANSSSPGYITQFGSYAYFMATDATYGTELWRTDGTTGGTALFKDIRTGSGSSVPVNMTVVGSIMYFFANNGTTGSELWKTDGTADGTVLVKDIYSGASGSSGSILTAVGSTLFFTANDGTNGVELWKSDGTEGGTTLVKDIYSGATGSSPYSFTVIGSTLYFAANDNTNGTELWKSDGTTGGTVMVKNINTSTHSYPGTFAILDGSTLIFDAADASNGTELWKSDGTEGGTTLVKNIRSGATGSSPTDFKALGSKVYFTANDGTNGVELWETDGTTDGTVMVYNIASGGTSSTPDDLVAGTSSLYFKISSPNTGLWKLEVIEPPTVTTTGTSTVSTSTAILLGNITDIGITTATVRGFNYGTTTAYSATTSSSGSFTSGSYSETITGLTCETIYHIRAFAQNSTGIGYGSDASFTTSTCEYAPTVTTSSTTDVTLSSATLNGNITSTGNVTVTERGFNYGTTTTYSATTTSSGSFSTGTYTQGLTDLICETTYHVRAYAKNYVGVSYGSDETFTTGTCEYAPTITTQAVSDITVDSGVFNGTIVSTGNVTVTERGFNYGTTIAYSATTSNSGSFSAGSYTGTVSDLECATTYHVRAYAENAVGISYGSDQEFVTSACPVTVTEESVVTRPRSQIMRAPLPYTAYTYSNFSKNNEVSSIKYVPVKQGQRSEDIRNLQKFLNSEGYTVALAGPGSAGNETDFFGNKTFEALKKFQMDAQIPVTGVLDEITKNLLDKKQTEANSLKVPQKIILPGERNSDVKKLQSLLIEIQVGPFAKELAKYGSTGYFGPTTREAVKEFQRKNNIQPTGNFGPQTQKALLKLISQ